ncbi:DapH/DapD/GlmU-related protein [uncultured Ilyobacter sp.]|uniref:acyltransferase n=1 Tax=uncultured Ilyobacter sp. TaxID=544433 RepID=UPI0029C0BFD9|nr:DapH/DapD/GlmU-related protein [uncultured Ilyobacter sp.]
MAENNFVKMYKNVKLGENVVIEEFCVIGKPPRGKEDGELETIIGDHSVIRSGTVIYAGNKIGNNFNTGHNVVIREESEIGNDVSVGTLSCIEHHIKIEDEVRIHSQVFIPEFTVIKKNAWIGPSVVVTNAKYPRSKNVKDNLIGAYIEENVKIGANVTTLPGIKIGKNALIGSGTLVSKDVNENDVVVGNPCKKIQDIRNIDAYRK